MQGLVDDLFFDFFNRHFFADHIPVDPCTGDIAHKHRADQSVAGGIEYNLAIGCVRGMAIHFKVDFESSCLIKSINRSAFSQPIQESW